MSDEKLGLLEMFCTSSFVNTNKTRFLKGVLVIDDVALIEDDNEKFVVVTAHDNKADIVAIFDSSGKRVSTDRQKRDKTISTFQAERNGTLRTFAAEEGDDGLIWLRVTGEGVRTQGQKVFGSHAKASVEQMLRAYAKHLGFAPIVKKEIVVAALKQEEK